MVTQPPLIEYMSADPTDQLIICGIQGSVRERILAIVSAIKSGDGRSRTCSKAHFIFNSWSSSSETRLCCLRELYNTSGSVEPQRTSCSTCGCHLLSICFEVLNELTDLMLLSLGVIPNRESEFPNQQAQSLPPGKAVGHDLFTQQTMLAGDTV
ncbi:hypothetical protein TMatcc_009420 [Talaromyces marneffei ATCC 18224]